MDESRRGSVALATTEMATNLVKHAGRGHILVQRMEAREDSGLRVISVDKGPEFQTSAKRFPTAIPLQDRSAPGLGPSSGFLIRSRSILLPAAEQ